MSRLIRQFSTKAKVYILEKHFQGKPKSTDVKLVEEDIKPLKDGEFLAEAVYLSLDPYMRVYTLNLPLGNTFIGSQVAKIIDSRNSKFPIGQHVVGEFGWRTHTIVDDRERSSKAVLPKARLLQNFDNIPVSLALGVLGMTGVTANLGLQEICQPKSGETILVNGAAGAVGSIVGQIGKILQCNVIGVAGSDKKGQWLTEELKFDHFLNYKSKNFKEALKEVAPNGIDCFFDNVGGQLSTLVMNRMNMFGRVAVCGLIAGYNDRTAARADAVQFPVIAKQLKMEGLLVNRWFGKPWFQAIEQNKKWLEEDKLKNKETITHGFENIFEAFLDMLEGGNTGKTLIKV